MNWLIFILLTLVSAIDRINDYNFDKIARKSGDYVLVDFYADWCRHCQQLMPVVEKLAEAYSSIDGIQVVKLNGGDRSGRKSVLKYNVEGFPALGLFHNDDEPIFYEGARDFESINNFLKLATGTNQVENPEIQLIEVDNRDILTVNDNNIWEKVLKTDKKTMLFVSGSWCTHCKEVKPVFYKLNEVYSNDPEIQFATVNLDPESGTTDKIRAQFGVESVPAIFLFDPTKTAEDGLKRPIKYDGKRKVYHMINFINRETGLSRKMDGRLDEKAGRITDLETKIKNTSKSDYAKLAEELAQSESFEERYYGKVLADKINIKQEINRLEQLTEKFDHIRYNKQDEIIKRINILRYFK